MLRKKWQMPLFIAFFMFGLLISTQYNIQLAVINSLTGQSTEDLVALVKSLNEKRSKLEKEVNILAGTKRSLDEKTAASSILAASLNGELKQMEVIAGTVPVNGPGIKITITVDSNLYYRDLIELVNELWVSGAEAISINEYRIESNTMISEARDEHDRTVITVNNKALLSPVIIKAIGDPDTLDKGLTFTGGIIDTFNTIYQVFPVIKKEKDVVIPATSAQVSFKYLKW